MDGVRKRECIASKVNVARFMVDLPACRPEADIWSQIFRSLVCNPSGITSMDGVALGTKVHAVRGRVDFDIAFVYERKMVDTVAYLEWQA